MKQLAVGNQLPRAKGWGMWMDSKATLRILHAQYIGSHALVNNHAFTVHNHPTTLTLW
jgi:hypothetical protein